MEVHFEGRKGLMLRGPTSSTLVPTYLSAAILKPDVATELQMLPALGSLSNF